MQFGLYHAFPTTTRWFSTIAQKIRFVIFLSPLWTTAKTITEVSLYFIEIQLRENQLEKALRRRKLWEALIQWHAWYRQ